MSLGQRRRILIQFMEIKRVLSRSKQMCNPERGRKHLRFQLVLDHSKFSERVPRCIKPLFLGHSKVFGSLQKKIWQKLF
jgi:hypothetical protein